MSSIPQPCNASRGESVVKAAVFARIERRVPDNPPPILAGPDAHGGLPMKTLAYLANRGADIAGHERISHLCMARRLAEVLGLTFGGEWEGAVEYRWEPREL